MFFYQLKPAKVKSSWKLVLRLILMHSGVSCLGRAALRRNFSASSEKSLKNPEK
jgi:hypothetical protein